MKTLTIAVPSYNVEAYLEKCLNTMMDSRLEQSLEVIIVDDGSTDSTARIAEAFVEKAPDVFSYVYKANGGHGSAVNAALERARGEYFRVIDADDWADADALAELLHRMEAINDDLVVDEHTTVDHVTGDQSRISLPPELPRSRTLNFDEINPALYIPFFNIHSISVRTRLLRAPRAVLLEHTYYVDYQFILLATARVQTVRFESLAVSFYRVGNAAQSVDHLNYAKRYDQHDRVLKSCLSILDAKDANPQRAGYLQEAVRLLIHTQLNIAFFYEPDRKKGALEAKVLRKELRSGHKSLWKRVRSRYALARALHAMRVDERWLERGKRLVRRGGK